MSKLSIAADVDSDGGSIASAVLGALGHEDREVRSWAVDAAAQSAHPDDLIAGLADPENAKRRNAALDALALGGVRSVPSLTRALRNDDPEVVMFAASALGKTRDKSAVPHLLALLDHDDVNVTQAAMESLALLRASAAVEPIIRILDRDPWVRFAGIHALGGIGDPQAVPALIPLLSDEDVRDFAIAALGKIRSPEALPHLAEVLYEAETMETFLTCLRAVSAVLERCVDPSRIRAQAWNVLASPDAAGVHMKLLAVLSGDQDGALIGVDERESKIAAAMLIRALQIRSLYTPMVLAGRDPRLLDSLEYCAVSLGEEIAESLRIAVSYHDKNVRMLACKCAADLRLESLSPRIAELVCDDEEEVRETAARALAYLSGDDSAKRLVPLLLDGSPGVRRAVHEALSKMDEGAVTAALTSHDAQDGEFLAAALEVMEASPHPEQRDFITRCLNSASVATRERAVMALAAQPTFDFVAALEPFLADPEPTVRRAVLRVISRQPSAHVRELVLEHITRDPATRETAVRAAADLGDPAVGVHLIDLLYLERGDTRMAIVDALAELREPAAEPVIAGMLTEDDEDVRARAARALAAFDSEMALRHLLAAARDPSPRVRTAVTEALCARPLELVAEELERLSLDEESYIATMARHRLEIAE